MRFIPVSEIKQGMILATNIYDERSVILLSANKKITKKHISQIKKLKYSGVYVYDIDEESLEHKAILSEELRIKAIKNLEHLNIDSVIFLTNKIVNEILNTEELLIDMKDLMNYHEYTYQHSINVTILSITTGIGLGLKNKELKELGIAAMLHDIGKISIDKNIIDGTKDLTDDEIKEIRKHPMNGYNMLYKNRNISTSSKTGVLYHHENEDGSGYPKGLKGNKIPLYAKIIHVADVYDALVSERSYKASYAPSEAIEYLMGNCGRMFNLEVVETFIRYIAVYPIGTKVCLSDGRTATVIKNRASAVLRPVVKTDDNIIIDLLKNELYYNIVITSLK